MSLRKTILATGQVYHILNRSIQNIPIFKSNRECSLFLDAMRYYLQPKPPMKYSLYRVGRERVTFDLNQKLVTIINYCLMPNHFHLTLLQNEENGIRKYIQRLTNSFVHYFNKKNKNRGPIFEGNFKAVRVESDEQLLHLSRYIHLNPVTAYLVERPEDYQFSSYNIYLKRETSDFIDPSLITNNFSSVGKYEEFVLNQKDYQRVLDEIKHFLLE